MPSSIGPNRYTPGQALPFKPDGRDCDHGNCDQTARHCVVGETDNMGSELIYLCDEHYIATKAAHDEKQKSLHVCDICKTLSEDCIKMRDPEEGLTGRLYDMCPDCRQRMYVAASDDLDDDGQPIIEDDFEPFSDVEPDDDPE